MIRDTLLVIDDSELDLAILNEIFKQHFRVVGFSESHQALSFLKQERGRICAVLLDICLGRRGAGFAVLYQLQTEQTTADLPVILITTDANEKDVRASVERGAVDFLVKPVDPHTVQERVCAVVRQAWPEGSTILDCPGRRESSGREEQRRAFYQDLTPEEAEALARRWFDKLCRFCRYRPELSMESHRRLGEIAGLLARLYVQQYPDGPLSREEAALIGLAAPFCDIGLLGLPEGEREEDLALHTELGWEFFTVEEDVPLFRVAAQIARWHHKSADGSGWPQDGDDVPLSAQIVRLALRIQHYLHYYQGYPDSLDRVVRTLAGEAGSVVSREVYQLLTTGDESLREAFRQWGTPSA